MRRWTIWLVDVCVKTYLKTEVPDDEPWLQLVLPRAWEALIVCFVLCWRLFRGCLIIFRVDRAQLTVQSCIKYWSPGRHDFALTGFPLVLLLLLSHTDWDPLAIVIFYLLHSSLRVLRHRVCNITEAPTLFCVWSNNNQQHCLNKIQIRSKCLTCASRIQSCFDGKAHVGARTDKLTFLSHDEALFNRTNFWEYLSQSFIRGRSWQPVDE